MTKGFPKEERHTLLSQIRRAAISIPTNIKGFRRIYQRQKGSLRHFYDS
nr:four helix bundle protein [Desulfobacterales bacterium]